MALTVNSGNTNIVSLFSSLSSTNSSSIANLSNTIAGLTTDYNSIKNGAYGKVTKAYYAKTGNDEVETSEKDTKKNKKTEVSASSLEKMATKATNLESSVTALSKNSLYTENSYNADIVADKVKGFINSYNSVINAADSSSMGVKAKANKLISLTESNESALNAIGITVGKDDTLSLDTSKFKTASASDVAALFGKNSSYASAAGVYADSIATTATAEGSTYGSNGSISSSAGSVGSLFDSLY